MLALACLLLLVSTLLAFRPALDKDFSFVNLDDNRYVYDNAHVTQGLTGDSIRWAYTSLEYDNWHPLTWLSLMVDRQLFGPESVQEHGKKVWGYHLTNILIHAINVIVLFLALRWMTSAFWPSLLVAVLFGLHPLRAESVAWISERKDVLSGLFFLATLWAYAVYAKPGRSWLMYALVIALFIGGLMAKPMLVILPVLLLLLDYWPLGRLPLPGAVSQPAGNAADWQSAPSSWPRILLEKAPLVALAIASSVVTVIAQRGAMLVIDTITFPMRLQNAVVLYATYIGEIFYPVRLAPLYPFPEHGVPWQSVAVSGLVLAAITALVVGLRAWRWLTVGWLWYLVALVPVIGMVQVGVQSMADRYTYLPHIGLYIMLAWTAEKLLAGVPARQWLWGAALVILIPVLVESTAAQTATWKDSETLWTSALKANPNIALAENNLGYIVERNERLDEATRLDQAMKRYEHAVEIRPRYVEAQINLGNVYMRKAQALKPINKQTFKELTDEALKHYNAAIEIRPDYDLGYVNKGTALMFRGEALALRDELVEAENDFRTALKLNPASTEANWKLGLVLGQQGKFDEEIEALRKTVEINPKYSPAHWRLGLVLCERNKLKEGIDALRQTLEVDPNCVEARQTLLTVAQTLFNQGRWEEGIDALRQTVEVDPNCVEAWRMLVQVSQALFKQGRWDEAIRCCHVLLQQPATVREAKRKLGYLYYIKHQPRQALDFWTKYLDANPDSLPVLTMTAWLLATDPDQAVRSGSKCRCWRCERKNSPRAAIRGSWWPWRRRRPRTAISLGPLSSSSRPSRWPTCLFPRPACPTCRRPSSPASHFGTRACGRC